MKLIPVLVGVVVFIAGCSRGPSPVAGSGGVSPSVEQPPVVDTAPKMGSIGTMGGGGTLVFSFRHGALLAKQLMEAQPEIAVNDPANDGLNRFYTANRARWIQALSNFVEKPEVISESSEHLSERGIPVGALSLPEAAPTNVVLSAPYLTLKDGFPESKAIALAIHEAGHFAVPGISDSDHKYLDQVAVLLHTKRTPPKFTEMKVPFNSTHGSVQITSDGLRLIQFPGDYSIRITNLETGWVEILKGISRRSSHADRGYLGEDWIYLASDDNTYVVRNLLTNQRITLDVSDRLGQDGLMANLRGTMWVKNSVLHIESNESLVLQNLSTGEKRVIELPFHEASMYGGPIWSPGLKTMTRKENNAFSVVELSTGRILEFVRAEVASTNVQYIDENRILFYCDRGFPDKQILVNLASGRTIAIPAGKYLGAVGNSLWFTPSLDNLMTNELVSFDIDSMDVTKHPFAEGKHYNFSQPIGRGKFMARDENANLFLLDLADLSQAVAIANEKAGEEPISYSVTATGPITMTKSEGKGQEESKIVLRWLNR